MSLQYLLREADDSESIFYNKIDIDHIGAVGHSQGGVGAFNAVTDTKHRDMYKTVVAESPAHLDLAMGLEWDYDIFADLAKNSYYSTTCDGIPEYRLIAPDGTEYLINLSEQWVWRRTPDMIVKSVEPEEAMLTPSQWYFLTKRGAEIGMREDIYGW